MVAKRISLKCWLKLTKAAEGDEPSHHQSWMEVELLLGDIVGPSVALAVVEDPEHRQGGYSDEEDGRQRDDERILAPLARTALILVRLV